MPGSRTDRGRGPGRPRTTPEQRQELRLRVAAAALELFDARGYDQTRIDEIAERAGVSSRTLWRHFDSKAACLVPLAQETFGAGIVSVVRAWPRGLSFADHFAGVVPQERPEQISETASRFMRLIRDEPALDAMMMQTTRQIEHDLALALAERDGSSPDRIEVRSRAAVLNAAFRAATEFVAATSPAPDNQELLAAVRAALECVDV